MAGYFSNHSQPQTRFSSQQPQHGTANTHQDPPRARLPASRHFSTSLDPPAPTKTTGPSPPSGTVHPLRNTYVRAHIHLPSLCLLFSAPLRSSWVFWFRQQRAPGNKITNYEEGIKKVASFSSVSFRLHSASHLPQSFLPGRILLVLAHSPFSAVCPPTHNRLSFIPCRRASSCMGRSPQPCWWKMDHPSKKGCRRSCMGGSRVWRRG